MGNCAGKLIDQDQDDSTTDIPQITIPSNSPPKPKQAKVTTSRSLNKMKFGSSHGFDFGPYCQPKTQEPHFEAQKMMAEILAEENIDVVSSEETKPKHVNVHIQEANPIVQEEIDTLDTILEAMYDAVSKAQRNIRANNLHEINMYFPYNEVDEVYEPRMMRLRMPSVNGDDQIIDVPMYSLVHHHTLDIEEFKIRFKINLSTAAALQQRNQAPGIHGIQYKVSTDIKNVGKNKSKSNLADIELKCRLAEPPEGLSRIGTHLDKLI